MPDYNQIDDNGLVRLLNEGDPAAFATLYQRYKGLLYVYACRIVKDFDIAEDLVQEVFVYLWDKRETIQFSKSVSSFLYSSVRYKFLNLVDKRAVRSDYANAFQLFLERGEHTVDNYIAEKELAKTIEDEVDKLPPKMREIFLMSRKENLKNGEIATLLGLSEKTVKNQLSLAVKILRNKLGTIAFLYLLLFYKY